MAHVVTCPASATVGWKVTQHRDGDDQFGTTVTVELATGEDVQLVSDTGDVLWGNVTG